MGEEDAEGSDGGSLEEGALEDHIAHWIEVLDRWVKRVDVGLGRQDRGAAAGEPAGEGDVGEGGPEL
jgi:hypothetical protein